VPEESGEVMPVCFQLTKKGEETAAKLAVVDDLLCAHFGVTPDEKRYYMGWYDIIGLRLALGQTFETIQHYLDQQAVESKYKDDYARLAQINTWLSLHYTTDHWREHK
jgi:hypothetical protein